MVYVYIFFSQIAQTTEENHYSSLLFINESSDETMIEVEKTAVDEALAEKIQAEKRKLQGLQSTKKKLITTDVQEEHTWQKGPPRDKRPRQEKPPQTDRPRQEGPQRTDRLSCAEGQITCPIKDFRSESELTMTNKLLSTMIKQNKEIISLLSAISDSQGTDAIPDESIYIDSSGMSFSANDLPKSSPNLFAISL